MQTKRGFIGLPVLIAILFGIAVLGGGVYFVVHQQSPSQTGSEKFDTVQTLPTNNNQTQQNQPTTKTPSQTSPSEIFTATPTSGTAPLTVRFAQTATEDWRAYIDYGDGVQCPADRPGMENCSMFTHTYAAPGTYVASLKSLTGTDGATRPPLGRVTITVKGSTSVSQTVSVPGMTKYTDADFGFSFWYPIGWTVQKVAVDNYPYFKDGSVVAKLQITGGGRVITVREFTSTQRIISVPAGACFTCAPVTYYFDVNKRQWMKQYPDGVGGSESQQQIEQTKVPVVADISNNTMGGLHIFGGSDSRFGSSIVPLSARNFVHIIAESQGQYNIEAPLVKTILATDPTVATPVSNAEQIKTIQAEATAYGI